MEEWTFSYRVNAQNILESYNEAFGDFARQNGAAALLEGLLGTPLKQHIQGDSVLQLYVDIMEKARTRGKSIELPFRCDSPVMRRYMTMRVEPLRDGAVQFWTRVERTERFELPVPLLDTITPRNQETLTMCAWCKNILIDDEWYEIEDGVRKLGLFDEPTCPEITHSLCPTCKETLYKELAALDKAQEVEQS